MLIKKIAIKQYAGRQASPTKQVNVHAGDLIEEIKHAHQVFQVALQDNDKNYLRALHIAAKIANPGCSAELLRHKFEKRAKHFRQGSEIDVTRISPRLYPVQGLLMEDLFSITRGCWSMPFNKGFGRRLRFIVMDEYHEAVMGIIGLQSPPADLVSRDRLFNYPKGEKLTLVNNTLDAYTVGAIPPYSFLLGGKLCAGLLSADTIRRYYWRKYIGKKTWIAGEKIIHPLVAITTTSAFGRSSIYNRLNYKGRLLAEPIGYTAGYGMIHLEHLYPTLLEIVKKNGKYVPAGYGNGPKVRWQNVTNALLSLGISQSYFNHGLKREVFLFRLVDDLENGMNGGAFGAPISLEEKDISSYWKDRWAEPRAKRFESWNTVNSVDLIRAKLNEF